MTILRAIDITTRVARDVVCDEAGRLIVVVLGADAGAMAVWGEITGVIGAQTDLQVLLANNYVAFAAPGTILVRHTFNPNVVGAPFVVGANAAGQLVAGLNADQLDSQEGVYYLDRDNHTGTQLHTTVSDFDLGVYETLSAVATTDQSDVVVEYASPLYFSRADKVSQKPREVWMNDAEFYSADEYGETPANVPGIIWNETNGAFDPLNNSDFVIRRWRKAPSGFAPATGVDFYSEIEYLETSVASNNNIEATTSAIDLDRYLLSDIEAGNAYLQLLRVSIITRHMQAGLLDASNKYNVRAAYATSIGDSYTNFVDYTPVIPEAREDYQEYFVGGGQVFVQSDNQVFIDFRVANTGSPGRANHSMRLAYRWWRGA